MLAALPYPPETTRRLLYLLVAVGLWHLLLPGWFYRTSAVYLEGPLPAFLGAAFGLWLHRSDAARMQALAACGWAMLASIIAVVVFGTAIFGPFAAIGGLYGLLRNIVHVPLIALPRALGSGYAPYVFWESVKTLLSWGAIAYVVLLLKHGDLKSRFGGLLTRYSDNRTFTADQRKQWVEYRRRYAEAVKAGGPAPAAPVGLMPPGSAPAGSWHHRAKIAYWAIRIGIAIVGLLGFWTVAKEQLFGFGGQVFMRGLFGG